MMRNNYPKLLETFFEDTHVSQNEPLYRIHRHTLKLLEVNRVMRSLLPTKFNPFCRVANIRNNTLVLEAANASWIMRLSYEKQMLLSSLREKILPSLSVIHIKVNPDLMVK